MVNNNVTLEYNSSDKINLIQKITGGGLYLSSNRIITSKLNIDDNIFAVLDYNGKSSGQISLEKSFNLEKLHIKFTDYELNPIDFNNQYHILHFKIKAYNKQIEMILN